MGLDILLEWQVLAIIALLAVATPVILKSKPAPSPAKVRTGQSTERAERALRRPDEAIALAAIKAQVSQNLRTAQAARARLMADLTK